ncbi:phenylacetate--CoA ligase family protein [Azospirillum endophyticum]
MDETGRDASDFLDRDGVLAVQRRKLAALGRRLGTDPAWRAHFAKAGMAPEDLADPANLQHVPTLEKADLRAQYPYPFLTAPLREVARFCATSGTTGLPVLFGYTRQDMMELVPRQLGRIFRTVGIRPGDPVYQGYGYGMWIGGVAMDSALMTYGATNFGIGPGRGELVAEWLRDHGYVACTMSPLWLMTLVRLAQEKGIDPKRDWKLRIGVFGGQSVSRQFRDEIEAAMPDGFVAHNIYGTTEAGGPVVGISCPHSHDSDEMHLINEDSILTEIVDPLTMKPVGPGEVGEIVVTTLDKQASPVVRWRTRDLVRLSDHPHDCPCGRHGLPLIGRIIGRSDDMLKVRGVMVFPSQVEDIIAATPGTVKEAWHIYVDRKEGDLDGLTVAVERQAGCELSADLIADRVVSGIHARLGIRCKVECQEEGVLPRYEAKAVRVHVRSPAPVA